MTDIVIHTPPVASSDIERDLCSLTEHLTRLGLQPALGLLGGEFGYGCEYVNDVFEMHPYWWGDCTCGHDDREATWERDYQHLHHCYQAELDRRGWREAEALAAEWDLPRYGCAVHCTCGRDNLHRAWQQANPHPPECPEVRPNFWHKPSGLEIRWYKWIGRSMEYQPAEPDPETWRAVFVETVMSVRLPEVRVEGDPEC